MTPGDPSLVFLHDRSVLAVVVSVGPDYIGCPELWDCDARLLDPDAVASWLTSVTPSDG
jgi:hypothetical protein